MRNKKTVVATTTTVRKVATARRRTPQIDISKRVNGRRDLNILNSFFSNESSALELASDYGISVGRVYQVLYGATKGKSLA